MIDVEQGALCSLEQDRLPRPETFPQQERGVGDVWLEPLGVGRVLGDDVVGVHRQRVVDPGQDLVLLHQGGLHLLPEDLGVEQVLHPDPEAGVLVGVGGPDPALGGADPVLPQIALDGSVELAVIGHDQVGIG